MRRSIALVCATALVTSAASATAASLITGKDVQNGSLTGADIKQDSVQLNRLSKSTQTLIKRASTLPGSTAPSSQGERGQNGNQGPQGPGGQNGQNGQNGARGDKGDRGDGLQFVTAPGNGWIVTNPSVKFTNDGATFGPYGNSGAGGSVKYTGLPAGTTLADFADITYTASYKHTGASPDNGDAPYFRIFMDNDENGTFDDYVTFTPSLQAGGCNGAGGGAGAAQCDTSGRMIKYDVTKGTVRYDDDPGATPEVPWSTLVNQHKNDKVMYILVTTGFSQSGTDSGILNSLSYEINGQLPTTVSFSG
jgi:hypothetical protein